jgi:hypothetical protein
MAERYTLGYVFVFSKRLKDHMAANLTEFPHGELLGGQVMVKTDFLGVNHFTMLNSFVTTSGLFCTYNK